MKQTKIVIPNILIESKKKKRNKKIRKITFFILVYLILIYLFYGFYNICQYYYYHHEFIWQSPIYIKTPLRIVPKYYMDKDPLRYQGEPEYPTSPLQNDLQPTITPKPRNVPAKKISSIIEPIIGQGNYTYEKHKNKKYYNQIMEILKNKYTKWEDAMELQALESGFNPLAKNPTSGACGLPQALPCSKMKCNLEDIECQLNWQYDYITKRYGTITKALKFRILKGWY
jgi:hypothetical protein